MTARELTPAEQWARHDEDLLMLRILRARALESTPEAAHFEVAFRVLSKKSVVPECYRPPAPVERPQRLDVVAARSLVAEIEAGAERDPLVVAQTIADLANEVETLRRRVAKADAALALWQRQAGPGHPLWKAVADAREALRQQVTDPEGSGR